MPKCAAQRLRAGGRGRAAHRAAQGLARLPGVLELRPDVLVVALGANDGLGPGPLEEAEAALGRIVVTYVLPNGQDFEACWPVLRKYFGEVRPAAMMISAQLLDPRMKIEIEVTAMKQSA